MNPELENEIERLKTSRIVLGLGFEPAPGASLEEIQAVEEELGIKFDDNLRDMYLYSNGSRIKDWFVVSEYLACSFYSLEVAWERVLSLLRMDANGELWSHIDEERDERIQPKIWHAKKWFPFADSGVGTYVHFDGWPTDKGDYGQIVVYQHDPDTVYYAARNFLDFFCRSNDTIERYVRGEMDDDLYFDLPF